MGATESTLKPSLVIRLGEMGVFVPDVESALICSLPTSWFDYYHGLGFSNNQCTDFEQVRKLFMDWGNPVVYQLQRIMQFARDLEFVRKEERKRTKPSTIDPTTWFNGSMHDAEEAFHAAQRKRQRNLIKAEVHRTRREIRRRTLEGDPLSKCLSKCLGGCTDCDYLHADLLLKLNKRYMCLYPRTGSNLEDLEDVMREWDMYGAHNNFNGALGASLEAHLDAMDDHGIPVEIQAMVVGFL